MKILERRTEFTNFFRVNEVRREDVTKKLMEIGSCMVADLPESFLYADVVEATGWVLCGFWLTRQTRTVRVFRSLYMSNWLYLESGQPTPGWSLERLEMAYVARRQALISLETSQP